MHEKKEKTCKTCTHYRRHYIIHKDRATAVNCGHCVAVRLKKRRPDDAACGHYEYCDPSADLPDRQEVVDYLTVDFLKWVQEKALPPEVELDEGFDEIMEATSF